LKGTATDIFLLTSSSELAKRHSSQTRRHFGTCR